ncbi:hypothetical protein [Candidatus Thiosymbion oneisti]|uniref:hypothetical protein n=1 Tax=Candidatus Thiosymbion oneisti TaxID=589554 RepID=UPI00210CDAD4|nr:hypothetical protein [Candidatus Thiosymbion oneisti]
MSGCTGHLADPDQKSQLALVWYDKRGLTSRYRDSSFLVPTLRVETLATRWRPYDAAKIQPFKHMVEVLIEDIGYEEIGAKVKKPLEGIKIAGYVGCQTGPLRDRW